MALSVEEQKALVDEAHEGRKNSFAPYSKFRVGAALRTTDGRVFRGWLAGRQQCLVHVAVDEDDTVLGFTMVSLRPELLSDEPSAHLEAIALARSAEGKGIAQALLRCAEDAAKARGAESMTLHVFAVNERARRLYEQAGYDGELMRYIKHL